MGAELKKLAAIFFILTGVTGLLFAVYKNDDLDEAQGWIEWYGNIPFEYAGFKTTEGKLYLLETAPDADFTVKDIEALQGSMIYIEGTTKKAGTDKVSALPDGVFVVRNFKKISGPNR